MSLLTFPLLLSSALPEARQGVAGLGQQGERGLWRGSWRERPADEDVALRPQVLYLDAVEYFPDEMQEILDLMTEKELRVRLPLEELELLLED